MNSVVRHTSRVEESRSAWVEPPVAEEVTGEYWPDGAPIGAAWETLWASLSECVGDAYAAQVRDQVPPELLEFEHGPATYLFDNAGGTRAERTVLVAGRPEPPSQQREANYQAGYPVPTSIAGRPLDRGHYIAHSGGGLFGPNIFAQDRALNRGWSRQGRLYRALERRAVSTPETILIARPGYADESGVPVTVDLGVVEPTRCEIYRFRNRYDLHPDRHGAGGSQAPIAPRNPDSIADLAEVLNGATSAQAGALGEEAAAAFLTENLDGTIVAMGDASMPREHAVQDLDIVAIIDGELIVFEVKTRFLSAQAGRRTRAGNLARPRLRRPTSATPRQGSQDYVASRLGGILDVSDGSGVQVRVLAVDLCLMEVQQFAVSDTGTCGTPIGKPESCVHAVSAAIAGIVGHRGYL